MNTSFIDVKRILESSNVDSIRNLLDILQPFDLAEIYNNIDEHLWNNLTKNLSDDDLVQALPFFNKNIIEHLWDFLSEEQFVFIINELDTDDATDILCILDEEIKDRVLSKLTKKDQILELMKYPEDSAGGIMQTELLKVYDTDKIQDVIAKFQNYKDFIDEFYKIFIIDQEGRLKGETTFNDLLLAENTDKVEKIATECEHAILPNLDQEEVANMFVQYGLVVLPVVDQEDRLIGRITYDDIHDVLEEEASEDMMVIAGVSKDELEHDVSKVKLALGRIPWLAFSMASSFLTGYVLLFFDVLEKNAITVASMVPLVMTMSGNIGTQSAMVTTREIAMGKREWIVLKKIFFKEGVIGFLVGAMVCLMAGITISFLHQDSIFGFIVSLSLITSMLCATLIGVSFPILFNHFKIDPAIAAGPLVTSSCDLIGVCIYLLVNMLYFKHILAV